MGLIKKAEKAVEKADKALETVNKELTDTSKEIQKTLDNSGKSVQMIVKGIGIFLVVSIITDIITLGVSLAKTKANKGSSITIQNLYLGQKK